MDYGMYVTKKFFHKAVFFSAFLFALAFLAAKIFLIPAWLEFVEPISIYTSLLSSVIFIYGFILSPVMQEYKESERLVTEFKCTIENIHADIQYFSKLKPEFSARPFLKEFCLRLDEIFAYLTDGKVKKSTREYLGLMQDQLAGAEVLGIPANHISRMKQELATFNRIASRFVAIRDRDSIPHIIHQLKNFMTLFILGTLLFLNVGSAVESTMEQVKEGLVVFFVSFIYLYLSLIISNLENPFDKRRFSGYIDLSFIKKSSELIQREHVPQAEATRRQNS